MTTIGESAFQDCSGLTGSLTLPSGLTTIGEFAFYFCSGLTGSLTLPSGLTTIESGAFSDCSGLTGSLMLPSGVTTIGDYAFYFCSGLTGNLTLPSGVTSIGDLAFVSTQLSSVQVSTENPNYSSSTDGVLFNKDKTALIYYPANRKGTYTIPDSVTSIEPCAFSGCSGLTGNLTLPSGVTSIGYGAFEGCRGLTGSLTLPSGLTKIGRFAFAYCSGLTGAYFRGNAPQVYSASDSPSFPLNLPLYYDPATTGWSTPRWNGYNAMSYEELCVVSFDANGGVGAIAGQMVEKGKSFVLTNEIPSRYGHAFEGWASSQTATTVEYQPGATVSFPADQILYAVWREETFSVKLEQVTAKEAVVSVNAPSSGVVLVAVYDKDGKLIQMGSQTMTKNTTSVTIPLNLQQLPEGGRTKVFLLDRGLWMPLCPTDGL